MNPQVSDEAVSVPTPVTPVREGAVTPPEGPVDGRSVASGGVGPSVPTPGRRPAAARRPWLLAHPPALVVGCLVLVVAELIAYQNLGLDVWLLVNCAIGAVTMLVVLVRRGAARRRGDVGRSRPGGVGGLLGRRLGRSGAGGRSSGRGLPRMLGGRGRTPSASGAGRGTAAGGRRPGLLGRLAGRGRSGGAAAGRPGLLGRLAGRRTGGPAGSRSAGAPGGGSSARRGGWPFGRHGAGRTSSAGGPRGSGGAGSGAPAGRRSLRSRLPRALGGTGRGAGTGGTGRTGGRAPRRLSPRSAWQRFKRDVTKAAKVADDKAGPKTTTNPKPPAATPAAVKPAATTRPDGTPARGGDADASPVPVPVPQPQRRRTPAMTEPIPEARAAEDMSIQGWGNKQLPKIAPAIHELAGHYAKTDEVARQTTAAVRKIAQPAIDRTLPADPTLAADLDAIASELQRLDDESAAINERRRALAAQAEALPSQYRTRHDYDEARVHGPRFSRAAEKRADVAAAEQDL